MVFKIFSRVKPYYRKKFLSKVVKQSNGCWRWKGLYSNGKPIFYPSKRVKLAMSARHAGYQLIAGVTLVDDSVWLYRSCNDCRCVSPYHMFVTARGWGRKIGALKKRGLLHEFLEVDEHGYLDWKGEEHEDGTWHWKE